MKNTGLQGKRFLPFAIILPLAFIILIGLSIQIKASEPAEPLLFLGNEVLAPMIFADAQGFPAGMIIEITQELSKKMNRPITIKTMNWSDAQQLVANGKADALMQINETAERALIYDFSEPLLETKFSIFTSTKTELAGLNSLKGLRVGVEAQGLPKNILKSDPMIHLIDVTSIEGGFEMLASGKIDAVVADQWVGGYVLATHNISNVHIVGDPIARSNSAFAVQKGKQELLAAINLALRKMKADGTYEQILAKWEPKQIVFMTRDQIQINNLRLIAQSLVVIVVITMIFAMILFNQRKKLKAVKDQLEEFFAINLDLLCIANVDGNFVRVNKAWEVILGYAVKDLEERRFLDFVHPDDMQATIEALSQLKRQEQVLNFTNRYRCKDGSYRFIEWRSHPQCNLIYAAARDITSRIQDGEQLQKQKEQFELAIRGSNDGIWDWDLLSNKLFLSSKWKEQLGFDDDEVTNELAAFKTLLHPDDKERILKKLNQCLAGELSVLDNEFRMLHKNGSYRWVRMRGEALKDPSGKVYRMAGSQTDINRRKEMELALKISEEQYRMITENISDVISVYNISKNCYTFYSPSVEALRGYTVAEAMTQSLEDIVKHEYVNIIREKITNLVATFAQDPALNGEVVFEVQTRHKNGECIWVETSAKVKRNKHDEIEILGVTRNIDKRKKAELDVEYLSYHDNLTGLFNRHFFDKRLSEEMARADRHGCSLSLILFDLDHFKKVNDNWGHPMGDEVLKRTAAIVGAVIRKTDVLVRFGGEEFIIIMPETTTDGAYMAAEKVRQAVASTSYPLVGTITVSLGIAERIPFESFLSFYKRLDDALYKAKRSGRNCSCIAESNAAIVPTAVSGQ